MSAGWQKFYKDGSMLIGEEGSSWSGTNLKNMVGVQLYYQGKSVCLFSEEPTEYHQSDDYEYLIASKRQPRLIARRIQKKLPDGRWETMEIDLLTGEILTYISEHRI